MSEKRLPHRKAMNIVYENPSLDLLSGPWKLFRKSISPPTQISEILTSKNSVEHTAVLIIFQHMKKHDATNVVPAFEMSYSTIAKVMSDLSMPHLERKNLEDDKACQLENQLGTFVSTKNRVSGTRSIDAQNKVKT